MPTKWVKPSMCGSNEYIEVRLVNDTVLVRNSGTGVIQHYPVIAWLAFTNAVKNNEFDIDALEWSVS